MHRTAKFVLLGVTWGSSKYESFTSDFISLLHSQRTFFWLLCSLRREESISNTSFTKGLIFNKLQRYFTIGLSNLRMSLFMEWKTWSFHEYGHPSRHVPIMKCADYEWLKWILPNDCWFLWSYNCEELVLPAGLYLNVGKMLKNAHEHYSNIAYESGKYVDKLGSLALYSYRPRSYKISFATYIDTRCKCGRRYAFWCDQNHFTMGTREMKRWNIPVFSISQ